LYGSENWTIKAREATRKTTVEVKYMRKIAGHSWTDYETNTEITKVINIIPVLDKIQECKRNCLQHESRMQSSRLQRILKRQTQTEETGETIKELSRRVRRERVNK
jgi:hypothetical protein